MSRLAALAIATVIPPTQVLLMIGAVLLGPASFSFGQWVIGFLIPFGSWYMVLAA